MGWIEILKILATIIVAIVGTLGGGYFGYKKFLIERKDNKEEKNTQHLIDVSIAKAKEEMQMEIKESVRQAIVDCGAIGDKAIRQVQDDLKNEFRKGLEMRGEEGKTRFDINSRQIEQNSKQIEEILGIVKDQAEKYDVMAESLTTLNRVVEASAESQRNSNYDRFLMVANKALINNRITITEKTNLNQLFNSWVKLGGKDPKITTLYDECMKLITIPDEGV